MQDFQKQVQDIERRIAELAEITEAAHDALVDAIECLTEALTVPEEKPKTIHDPAYPDWEPKPGEVVYMSDGDIDESISYGLCYAAPFDSIDDVEDGEPQYQVGGRHWDHIRRIVQP